MTSSSLARGWRIPRLPHCSVSRDTASYTHSPLKKKLTAELAELSENEWAALGFAGDAPEMQYDPESDALKPIKQDFFQRRYKRISVTELAVVFPAIFLLL